ncbi:hypothetical protein DNTS_033664 [Danionella cerebrum]|uniref:Major facilitator superfamily (MFS) profile domain-containing protein n=1 Tax=Danionella cerebrum TaxID=2873325 RepID=A0A553RFT1_9TELE|nr:hypothetical protein DNTS_033664 [Danionella translucida]
MRRIKPLETLRLEAWHQCHLASVSWHLSTGSSECGVLRECMQAYKAFTFGLTFLLYTSFHLSRKPISIVKLLSDVMPAVRLAAVGSGLCLASCSVFPSKSLSELHKNCSRALEGTVSSSQRPGLHPALDCSWKPFDRNNYKQLLGAMDYSFLCAYAVGMYLSGIIGERLPIRLYLTVGMLSSGLFTCLFGLGYVYDVHSLGFYIFVQDGEAFRILTSVPLCNQVANGLVQTTGWPSVVTCIGNWFGKGRRGLIMGVWNSHTSVGNILGSLIAGYYVSSNWGLSFIVPGVIIAAMGILCFFFLIERKCSAELLKSCEPVPTLTLLTDPNDLKTASAQNSSPGAKKLQKCWNGVNGHKDLYLQYKPATKEQNWDTELLLGQESVGVCVPVQQVVVVKSEAEPSAISFMGALRIPGVVEFSLCLLFAKLVSYTFLFWLPLYITKAAHLDAKQAGDLSTLFDVGGIVGGILAGVISDKMGKRATTCAVMLLLAAPTLYGFSMMSQFGLGPTIGMLLVCGGLVNGPYALITTAVSADLGTHKSLKGNARALSTVTAIIDGTGSVGAALGPLLAGVLSARGWNRVFYMLMTADFFALLVRWNYIFSQIETLERELCGMACCN